MRDIAGSVWSITAAIALVAIAYEIAAGAVQAIRRGKERARLRRIRSGDMSEVYPRR